MKHPILASAFLRLRHLLELTRFSHTLFALPLALLAAAMAWKANRQSEPPIPFRSQEAAGIVLCMVFARSAAMAFNRLADRRLDALNPRTASRHLPAGTLGAASVAALTLVCSLGFVSGTLLFLPNRLPLYASLPVLVFLFAYSFTKRWTVLSHFWLGTALALAPPAAWLALGAEVAWPPLVLGGAVIFWVAGFDVIYACQDAEFDARTRLFSIPARWGVGPALRLAAACHAGMVVLLAMLPLVYAPFAAIWLGGVAAIAVLLIYEHRLVRPDDLTRVNRAFFQVNAVVSVGLFVVGTIDLIL
jgi:4-hydroxybenzoate polyprenyltransferase